MDKVEFSISNKYFSGKKIIWSTFKILQYFEGEYQQNIKITPQDILSLFL